MPNVHCTMSVHQHSVIITIFSHSVIRISHNLSCISIDVVAYNVPIAKHVHETTFDDISPYTFCHLYFTNKNHHTYKYIHHSIYIYTSTYMHMHIYIHAYTHTHVMFLPTRWHSHYNSHHHKHNYKCKCKYTYKYECKCKCICKCTCTYKCNYTYTYMHLDIYRLIANNMLYTSVLL